MRKSNKESSTSQRLLIDSSLRPSWKDYIQFIALGPRDVLLYLVCSTYRVFAKSFELLPPRYLAWTSRVRARRSFFRALRKVPAYYKFVHNDPAPGRHGIPEMDKERYIKAFSIESRCLHGSIPSADVMIDESSGSTGIPYNWVRLVKERHQSHLFISYFASYCFGEEPWITINAFSMGSWATGLNIGIALQKNSIVKNTGPDISKILHTLSFFGREYPYLITGYPPFLKYIVDTAEAQGFPLRGYRLNALVGGEGMSEGLRDYLLRYFQKVYSGYGATDVEIGIAGETPISVAIRRLARDNPDVRDRLFGSDSRLPMLFQYNPLMHYIEANDNREILITITRSSMLSPRIRYNIHDEGGVARYDEIAGILRETGHDIRTLACPECTNILRLPFLWVYGRRDFTISIMGANIYPEDIEQSLYTDMDLAHITRSFCQSLLESPEGEVRPCFHFEITEKPSEDLTQRFSHSILKHLREINADFRKAWEEHPKTMIPEIRLHNLGEGPFKTDSERIKQIRKVKA